MKEVSLWNYGCTIFSSQRDYEEYKRKKNCGKWLIDITFFFIIEDITLLKERKIS